MSIITPVTTIPNLATLGNVVPEGYLYYDKLITPGEGLSLPNVYFKWYDLYPADAEITPEQRADCRAFLATETQRLKIQNELGFVILHRAGSVLLLLITTWRSTNEMWESVYVKPADKLEEAYTVVPAETNHRGTYCVWELAIVWHERHAWVRFLSSARDEAAKLAYINDLYSGRT
jgi:hypothetical protein